MAQGTLPATPTVLVTGGTDGIGRETALELVRRGARVIVHGRRAERLAEVHAELERERGAPQPAPVRADLSDLADVRRLVEELGAREEPVHVLLNNAGVYMNERVISKDGFEMTMAVNHFAPFALTLGLLGARHGSALLRVVNVSSVAHARGRIDPADAAYVTRPFDGYGTYAASKLANVLFSVELAKRLSGSGPTVNALHPGVVSTKLLLEGFGMQGNDTLEEAASTSVYLALDPAVEGVTSRYFARRREAQAARAATNADLCREFFDASLALTGCSMDAPAPRAGRL